MIKSSIPLKSINSGQDLHELQPIEENYLEYCVGQHLIAAPAADVGNISLNSTGATSIGAFVDSFFNETVGTHPASQITSSETTTAVYQKIGTASEAGSDFKRPIGYYSNVSVPGFYEMVDEDLNLLAKRVITKLVSLDYPGTFKLAATSPGSDYNIFINNIFSDTQTDGTTVPYSVYVRSTITVPAVVRPIALNNNTLKEMSDAEIQYTLGQRIKTLRASAGEIGSYQLRSSVQGAPTGPGVWKSVGTALNTNKDLANVSYARTRASVYTTPRASVY